MTNSFIGSLAAKLMGMTTAFDVADELETAERIAISLSDMRLRSHGGYPDDIAFRMIDGVLHVIIATLDAGKEYAAPDLIIMPAAEFIEANRWVIEDEEATS